MKAKNSNFKMFKLQHQIKTYFKTNGLNIKSDAMDVLKLHIERNNLEASLNDVLNSILEYALNHSDQINASTLDKKIITHILASHKTKKQAPLMVVDAFSCPRLIYNADDNKIQRCLNLKNGFDANSKTDCYIMRYNILFYRLSHSKLFSILQAKSVTNNAKKMDTKKFQVRQICQFKGSSSPEEHLICLAMLTRLKNNILHLEDPTGHVELNTSETVWHDGIFCESQFVLAEGYFMDNVFHALAIGFPPLESEYESRKHLGDTNFFAPEPEINPKTNLSNELGKDDIIDNSLNTDSSFLALNVDDKLLQINAYFVILSDIFLDDSKVIEKLDKLFAGYNELEHVPYAFIMCGSFLSHAKSQSNNQDSCKTFSKYFNSLAYMIYNYKQLAKRSKFIFIPHLTQDPGIKGILPKHSLPKHVKENFEKAWKLAPSSAKKLKHSENSGATNTDSITNYNFDMMDKFIHSHDVEENTPNEDSYVSESAENYPFLFGTNPCRIQFMSYNIVVFRCDLMCKMLRNAIHLPNLNDSDYIINNSSTIMCETGDDITLNDNILNGSIAPNEVNKMSEQLAYTILSQSHLNPLPQLSCPIILNLDHSLGLYPLPDLVIVADKYLPYTYSSTHHNAFVVNPGSFAKNRFSFKVYYPYQHRIEDSQIP